MKRYYETAEMILADLHTMEMEDFTAKELRRHEDYMRQLGRLYHAYGVGHIPNKAIKANGIQFTRKPR